MYTFIKMIQYDDNFCLLLISHVALSFEQSKHFIDMVNI